MSLRKMSILVAFISTLFSVAVFAENEAKFYPETGRLFVPAVEVGGNVYLLELKGPFNIVDVQKISKIAPLHPGGNPGSPSEIQLHTTNAISANTFNNYFEYSARAGETIYIHITFDQPLAQIWKTRCAGSPSAYYHGIAVDGVPASCDEDLVYEFEQDGVYRFWFDFPDDLEGYFEAAVTNDG